jgi:hypothetical protein
MSKLIKAPVVLYFMYLKKIPDIFQDVKVLSGFNCSNNELISLKGAPEYVGSYFDCSHNQLSTLNGAPKYVGGSFFCNGNQLSSLEDTPDYIGSNFWCFDNAVQFTEEQVRAVCNVKGKVYV